MPEGNENDTKRLIRETATRLFREKSFEAVTLNDICKASGINKHTFYYYYKSKDELLKEFYCFPWQLTPAEVTAILTSDNYVEQMFLIIEKYTDFVKKTGVHIIRQIFIKNLTQDVGTFRVSNDILEIAKLEMSIIKKGQQHGQFHNTSDPKVLVVLLHQVLHSVSLMWAVFHGEFDISRSARYLLEGLLDVDASYRITDEQDLDKFTNLFNGIIHKHTGQNFSPDDEKGSAEEKRQ
ncbi:MAG: TetR/AcrR family transcriptional regulator [Clostridiales bacterium]|jgi:AcrR family transcriptional regulator|nr:TetR/AcrR family transcriptional regulator [Clostridiales bacterium]